MKQAQLKTTGKKVNELVTDLFSNLTEAKTELEVDGNTDNLYLSSNDKVSISVTSIEGIGLRKHLVKIETPDFTVTSDMTYQMKEKDEVSFESVDMETTFNIIKMLLIRNDYIKFVYGRMQRSDGLSEVANSTINVPVIIPTEQEGIRTGWHMD